MEDFIDELFSSVDEYYPGSKRKRKDKPQVVKKVIDTTWDSRSYVKTLPNGTDVEFFTLGSLAQALGRQVVTLRSWTNDGHLPVSPYRLPDVVDKNGDTRKGRRLYTRAMIEAAVEIFDAAGLLHSDRVEWNQNQKVTNDISEAWMKIRANESQDNQEK
jgi:hypothetical protein